MATSIDGARTLVRPATRKRHHRYRRHAWWTWMLPAALLTALFTVYPAVASVRVSFYQYAGYGPKTFTGIGNYRALWQDPTFRGAMWHTVQFAVVTAVGTVLIGGLLALHFSTRPVLGRTMRALVFFPVMLPVVCTGLVWVFGLDANFGWVDLLLSHISPSLAQGWLSSPSLVMWTIEAVTILQYSGLPMIIILAALQDLPAEVLEAAELDGVTRFQRVRYITVPLVRDVLVTITLLQLMYGFKVFDQVFVMTHGGPGNSSQVLSTYVYQQAFQLQHFGLGAAGAVVTSLLIIVVSMAYISVFRTDRMSHA